MLLTSRSTVRVSKSCRVTRLYADMPEEDRETFRVLIQDREFSGLAIAKILKLAGYSNYKINRHGVEHYRRKLESGDATL